MDKVEQVESLPEFQRGKQLLRSGDDSKLSEAVDVLGQVYSTVAEAQGDLAPENAPIALLYGEAMLKLAVYSNSVMMNMEMRKQINKTKQETEPLEEEQVTSKEEVFETFEIAWECLDLSRVIFERLATQQDNEPNTKRMRVYQCDALTLLGELKVEQGFFQEATDEYHKCLLVQEQDLPATCRDLGSTYHSLATALELAALEQSSVSLRTQAAMYYLKSQQVLRSRRQQLLGSEGKARESASSGSKKKKKLSREWLPSLSADQVAELDQLFVAGSEPLDPVPADDESGEIKELSELVTALGEKISDVTWELTEEAATEEKKKKQEQEKAALKQAEETTGFAAPKLDSAPTNVLQVRKRDKSSGAPSNIG